MQKYDGVSCEPLPLHLPPGVKEIEVAFHDECCFHANDQKKSAWLTDSERFFDRRVGVGWSMSPTSLFSIKAESVSLTNRLRHRKSFPKANILRALMLEPSSTPEKKAINIGT